MAGIYSMYHELIMARPIHECGVFGIYGPGEDVARLTYFGLYALQHRGQESAGIAVSNGNAIELHKDIGLVSEVFDENTVDSLKGNIAIGHVRYSSDDANLHTNAQPMVFRYLQGMLALAHNGSLTNASQLRQSLAATGSVFQTATDTEVMVNLIARYGQSTIEESLMKCMIDIKGAYSLVVMTEDKLIGVRDPFGVRPLCIGKLKDAYILASESCALDTVGAKLVRDVEPGEIVIIDHNGISSQKVIQANRKASCIFEYIYFARPDSIIDGEGVTAVRRAMGRQLAIENPIEADLVISVPDSGTAPAKGYAEEIGLPFEEGLMKNRYIGRTFIKPTQEMREVGVRLKLNAIKSIVKGKRIILVDDSIVRGTTSSKIVRMLREAGVKEVHMLVSSPPVTHPCYYGIDTSKRDELIAVTHDVSAIKKHIGADSLYYLSLEGMLSVMKNGADQFCVACFNGEYAIPVNP